MFSFIFLTLNGEKVVGIKILSQMHPPYSPFKTFRLCEEGCVRLPDDSMTLHFAILASFHLDQDRLHSTPKQQTIYSVEIDWYLKPTIAKFYGLSFQSIAKRTVGAQL